MKTTTSKHGLPARRGQRGAALLAFAALTVVVGTGVVLNRLNETAKETDLAVAYVTTESLAHAKATLLAYAIGDDSATRPGELPCPDVDYDGASTAGVDYTAGGDNPCVSLRGWLPHAALGLSTDLRDSNGERLWYALSDTYHQGHSEPLNSDDAGELDLDSSTDIVAVIIAPMDPLDHQVGARPDESATHNAASDVGKYLEDLNEDGDLTTYVTRSDGDFNDRVVAITRAELMAAVEKRVLGRVAQVLQAYRDASWNTNQAFPWMATLADPAASTFKASVGTPVGHLSYHPPNDAFATKFRLRWRLRRASISRWGTVTSSQLRQGDLNFTLSEGQCQWVRADQVTCTAERGYTKTCNGENGTSVIRTHTFIYAGLSSSLTVTAPKSGDFRRRRVKIPWTNPLPPSTTDIYIEFEDLATSGPESGNLCGTGTLQNDNDTKGRIDARNIRYELGVPAELPQWILDQEWHHLLYAAISDADKPGGSGNCPGVDCLTLSGVAPGGDKQAIVVAAGPALSGQDRSAWSLSDYFETENASTGDDTFAKAASSSSFNDQVRVVAP